MIIKQVETREQALTNCVYLNSKYDYLKLEYGIYKIINKPIDYIMLNNDIRTFNELKLDDDITPIYISKDSLVDQTELVIEINYFDQKSKQVSNISLEDLTDFIKLTYLEHVFNLNQNFKFIYNSIIFIAHITMCELPNSYINHNTNMTIITNSPYINLNSKRLFRSNFDGKSLGVGGLDVELGEIFRRGFVSRLLSDKVLKELDIKHVRGILLSGPPGCGKTLIARQIGKILNCREPKIVQGPSLLNKYVGESEKNVRELFADAIKNPDELHLIICDEFDALVKKRGNDSLGTSDNVVNTFLSMIDGPNQLNNILLICMTNRPDLIDDAVLRPGRLELHVEIGLPDEKGREEILTIHTQRMKDSGRLVDTDLSQIASLTKNFTGAELEGIIKNAVSYAVAREISIEDGEVKKGVINPIVTGLDLIRSVECAKPMFGKSTQNELYEYLKPDYTFNTSIYNDLVNLINTQPTHTNNSYLIYGSAKSGKTTLACKIASDVNVQYIKIITPQILLKQSNPYNFLDELVKSSCQKLEHSLLILDNFERLISFSQYEHNISYNNNNLQAILMTLERNYTKRLSIIITARNLDILEKLEVLSNIKNSFML